MDSTADAKGLVDRFQTRKATVGVVGMGYVGLPLSLAFHQSGMRVVGFDIDESKLESLRKGVSYIRHIPAERTTEALRTGRFVPTSDFGKVRDCDAVVICVPTPVTATRDPDLVFIRETGKSIAPHLKAGQLIVLESTTYPGTTNEVLRPILEERGLRAGKDFFLAFSPEREDPGNPKFQTVDLPKVVGGFTPACLEVGLALYGTTFKQTVPVSSTHAAEMVKLLENIYRSVNIALVNELKMLCHRMGLDIFEIIKAASTKPFGFQPFYPGPGLGGHCIPIDPFYLSWKAKEFGFNTKFIELAGDINSAMPAYVVGRTVEALNQAGKPMKGSKVLVVGVAYKKDVDDTRESPSFTIIDLLRERGAEVSIYDPYVPVVTKTREHAHLAGMKSVAWTKESLAAFDAAVVVTDHSGVNYLELAQWCPLVVDTRNAVGKRAEGKVVPA